MAAVVSPLLLDQPPEPAAALPKVSQPSGAETAATVAKDEAEAEAAARRAALAQLARGRLGTIATSARGILSPGQSAIVRRSLLGA
jgi:hypothetical protein